VFLQSEAEERCVQSERSVRFRCAECEKWSSEETREGLPLLSEIVVRNGPECVVPFVSAKCEKLICEESREELSLVIRDGRSA